MSTSHTFYETSPKLLARAENVRLYRELTGLVSIPTDKQYLCLCAEQRANVMSEINQMVSAGLLTKSQFVGVDRSQEIIDVNRATHPEATWHCGEWEDVISDHAFNPACIYLDTESLAGRVTLNMAATTMKLSPSGTVLLLNVMQSSRYKTPMESEEFLAALSDRVADLNEWTPRAGVRIYDYVSCSTLMRTYAFMRAA